MAKRTNKRTNRKNRKTKRGGQILPYVKLEDFANYKIEIDNFKKETNVAIAKMNENTDKIKKEINDNLDVITYQLYSAINESNENTDKNIQDMYKNIQGTLQNIKHSERSSDVENSR